MMPFTSRSSDRPSTGQGAWRTYAGVLRHQLEQRRGRGAWQPEEIPEVREEVRVDGGDHARFCRVVGAEAGEDAHLGYLHALTFRPSMRLMSAPQFPLPLLGLVHLENTAGAPRPVRCGTSATVVSRVVEFGEHRRGRTVLVRAELRDAAGTVLFWDESLYLHKTSGQDSRGRSGGREGISPSSQSTAGTDGEAGSAARGKSGGRRAADTAHEVLIGQWRLGPDTGREYARASGDMNPIHLSALSARAFGMPGTIAHGMYCAARALSQIGTDSCSGHWRVVFGKPVVLPARVLVWRKRDAAVPTAVGRSSRGRTYWTVEAWEEPGS